MKAAAAKHTKAALDTLVEIAKKGTSEAARVAAANAILDRAHGKPTQTIVGDKDNPLISPVLNVFVDQRGKD